MQKSNPFLVIQRGTIALICLCISMGTVFSTPQSEKSCIEWVEKSPGQIHFANFYTGWTDIPERPDIFMQAQKRTCSLYTMWWMILPLGNMRVSLMIPVYYPHRSNPIAYQVIYTEGYQENPQNIRFWGAEPVPNWRLRGLYAGDSYFPYGSINMAEWGGAYLRSLEEPFRSAPQIQMYYYLGQPLLVARSASGIVTDVYFQWSKNIIDPMARAKLYLGEKWYHP